MTGQPKPERTDPLAKMDLGDFAPTPPAARRPKPAPETIRAVSEAVGFPSREAAPKAKPAPTPEPPARIVQRRHRTGRNAQLSLKVTQETKDRFVGISDAYKLVQGELLAQALDAWEAQHRKPVPKKGTLTGS